MTSGTTLLDGKLVSTPTTTTTTTMADASKTSTVLKVNMCIIIIIIIIIINTFSILLSVHVFLVSFMPITRVMIILLAQEQQVVAINYCGERPFPCSWGCF